jgi:predicted dithiol-disulfide oxidoreductase (DUF899 family)
VVDIGGSVCGIQDGREYSAEWAWAIGFAMKLAGNALLSKDTLAIYSFMYGPKMKSACPACTSILDSLNGTALHATQRINLAVVARNPLEKIRTHARNRGWRNLRLLSSAGNAYNHDYQGETGRRSRGK